jgi:predicted alpha/beta hydrolase
VTGVSAATTVSLHAHDGVRLAAHRIGPAGGMPAVLLPGTFSNARFWLGTRDIGFARDLAGRGYHAWCLDPRGHGGSQRLARGDRWTFDQWGRADARALIIAASEEAGRPVFAVGHSAGGASLLAALAAEPALRPRVAAMVIVATPLPWLQPWRRAAARSLRALTAVTRSFPARLLRLGPEDEPAGVMRQWLDWNLERRWTGDDGTDYVARFHEVHVPVLGIVGAGDRSWSPPAACSALIDMLGSADRSFSVFGTDTGFSRDFGHVDIIAGRAARAEVWPQVMDWADARVRGSG